jgi:glutathione synthase/RimK-type ligase-like ATP-grasp enzyme
MSLSIFAHNAASAGARALSEALGVRRIRAEGSTYRGGPNKTVINWGSSSVPDHVRGSSIINPPEAVRRVTNKLDFFRLCEAAGAPRIPEFTVNKPTVRRWLEDGKKVVVRRVLNGHSGAGIEILEGARVDIPDAPLYTVYVPKKEEWRMHVFRNGAELVIIDQQRKIRDPEFEGVPDWNVRSHANGFIFAREVAPPHPDVLTQALKALEVSGLDFGAVDVVYNHQKGQAFVLEINSAPGLVGTTIQSYANAFRRFV